MLHAAEPVKATVSVADCPLQIVVEPLISAVGRVFTVIIALPLISAAIDEHLLSLAAVSVYVLVAIGDTAKE